MARKYIQEILGIKKTRFFALAKQLKADPENFSIMYSRKMPTRKISKDIEENIVKELKIEKDLIKAKDVPTKYYNYSYMNKHNYPYFIWVMIIHCYQLSYIFLFANYNILPLRV